MRPGIVAVVLIVFVVVAALTWAHAEAMVPPQTTGRTVLEGVYTEAQAMRGRDEFTANCSKCHEGVCPDGPPLVGPLFIERWREDSLAALFTWMKTRMPRNAAGSLSDATYIDAIAFLLQENAYPSGSTELTADMIGNILFVGKNGPRPLPPNSLVLVVGCLKQDPGEGLLLINGSAPVRNRYGDETAPDELKAAEVKPTGMLTFQLQNVEDVRPGFGPDAVKGHKVQVKGVLGRQGSGARIFVTSIEALMATCS
jgi:hypothetical protein